MKSLLISINYIIIHYDDEIKLYFIVWHDMYI